ncbi:MAG: hypothetical protein PHG00_03245 [Methylococcales bacterium]|nr:hypothetical protein [Methylococcales bacterium]
MNDWSRLSNTGMFSIRRFYLQLLGCIPAITEAASGHLLSVES